jgi:predicted AlkP superfamily phosphohydrolase/phosphomutase
MTLFLLGIDQQILPLTLKMVSEGGLPNLEKLIREGTPNQILCSFPLWTPTNWATASTGADTGTHGLFAWQVKMPSGQMLSSFHSNVINAETIWEAAERVGLKSAVIHYPASMPARIKDGYIVDGDAAPGYGETRFEIAPSLCYTNLDLPNAANIKLTIAEDWRGLPENSRALEGEMRIIPKFKGEDRVLRLLFTTGDDGYDRALVCTEKDVETKIADIREGEWSEWAFEDFVMEGKVRRGSLRYKLIELSPDAKRMRIFRSQVMPIDGFTYPDELGAELIEAIGPYQEHVSEYSHIMGWTDYDTSIEEAEYQAQWFAKAALYLAKEKGAALFYSHWHFLDHVNHHHLANVDPAWVGYDPEEAKVHWEMIRKAYEVIDQCVGYFLEHMGEEDHLLLLSDHGCIPVSRQFWLEKFLRDKGFLVRKDESLSLSVMDDQWESNIDWERTKVYLKPAVTIDQCVYVNAEGEEREMIQDEVIRELRTLVDEETGKTPIAIALKKRDASILGCWGENVGDIVLVVEPEYTISSNASWDIAKEGGWIKSRTGVTNSAHGPQLPTYQSEVSSHMAMFVLRGPGVKKGYVRPPDELGYVKMIDIVPTICHILGIAPPAQSQGAVAYDLFEGHEMVRKLPVDRVKDRELDERVILQRGMHDYAVIEDDEISEKHYAEILRKVGRGGFRRRRTER